MSTTATQKLVSRDIRSQQEFRRGTVLTDAKRVNFDTSGITSTVYVVDVDIDGDRPIRDVIVKSTSGIGGRAYARVGLPVEIQRNMGGRWFATGASDRVRSVGAVQLLDLVTETFGTSENIGFTSRRRPYNYYSTNLAYGVRGYGSAEIVDGDGNEVTL